MMIIAAVIDEQEIIVPIVEGEKIRLYDTETKLYQEFSNPAAQLKEGRRGASLRFAEQRGAVAFAAPPQTFCELSYEKAVEDQVKFFHLAAPLPFSQFKEQIDQKTIAVQEILPENEIAPSLR